MLCRIVLILALTVQASAAMSQPVTGPAVKVELVKAQFGGTIEVGIDWVNDDTTFEISSFDILMEFDAAALSVLDVTIGQLLNDCEWEYFAYRVGTNGNCGGTRCPPNVIRFVAIADLNNGTAYPTCFGNRSGRLATLLFQVTPDTSYACQFLPVRFIWYDCGDNYFESKSWDSLLISSNVYDYVGYYKQINQDFSFPTIYGAPDTCEDTASGVFRTIDFYNGGIDVECNETIDNRGDINLNFVANEIADWVLFADYFLYGPSVFNINSELQAAATDVNADSITLTLDDLVYLQRIILGDAVPFPRSGGALSDTATFVQQDSSRTVSLMYPDSLTAYYLVFRGNIVPTSQIPALEVAYNFDGSHTRVLATFLTEVPPIFLPGQLLTYTGNGLLEEAYASRDGLVRIESSISYRWLPRHSCYHVT